jgi:predicted hotdog family 3-hydroxylacyl-ACP dehydratase
MRLDRRWIENHIPHKGGMCLLDEVLAWDPARIRCRSATHRNADNPLRAHGRLGAACGIEYAAQAMAVHGALIADLTRGPERPLLSTPAMKTASPTGYLASVRNVALHVARLDDLETDLVASAQRITGDERTLLYQFSVSSADRVLLSGRAAIVADRNRG